MKSCLALMIALAATAPIVAAEADLAKETFTRWVSPTGDIRRPEDFRTAFTHLGSWMVADEKAPGYGFHDVYAQAEAVRRNRENGRFPDGTVLVKEIRKIRTGDLTTGHAAWAGEPAVWFVMVKNEQGRFKGNSHWQEGWGWALFEAKSPAQNVSKSFAETCQACHIPAQVSDWVFVDGYPTLKP